VRKGLKGREAVAPSIKNMHGMFFIDGVTEPPQSPAVLRKKCAQNLQMRSQILIGAIRKKSNALLWKPTRRFFGYSAAKGRSARMRARLIASETTR
jgi:hypothetical protein